MKIGDKESFLAPEGLRFVATGEAASGAADDAEPVVKVCFPIPSLRRSEGFSNAGRVAPISCPRHILLLHEVPYTLVPAAHTRQLLCPAGANLRLNVLLHGLRFASPVATTHGPAGAQDRLLPSDICCKRYLSQAISIAERYPLQAISVANAIHCQALSIAKRCPLRKS